MVSRNLVIALTIALSIVLAGCAGNNNGLTSSSDDTLNTGEGVDGSAQDAGGDGPSEQADTDYLKVPVPTETFDAPPELKEEDIKIVGDGATQKERTLFWDENVFFIDPEKVVIPDSVKDVFEKEQYATLPNSILAILSETTMLSEIKAPYTKDSNPVALQMALRGFAQDNLTGEALQLFEKAIADYPKSNATSADVWFLYPHITEDNHLNEFTVRPAKDDGEVWQSYMYNFAITGVDEDGPDPTVTVEYDIEHVVPIFGKDGGNKYFRLQVHMKLATDPGLADGEWLISSYTSEVLN